MFTLEVRWLCLSFGRSLSLFMSFGFLVGQELKKNGHTCILLFFPSCHLVGRLSCMNPSGFVLLALLLRHFSSFFLFFVNERSRRASCCYWNHLFFLHSGINQKFNMQCNQAQYFIRQDSFFFFSFNLISLPGFRSLVSKHRLEQDGLILT